MENNNSFVEALRGRAMTETENGAPIYVSTDSAIVDQFGRAGNYRGRVLSQVFEEQEKLWNEDATLATKFPFYLRMITRKINIEKNNTTELVQNGQGARDEAFKRMLWIAYNHEETFKKNIWLLPIVGCWKDLWTLMYYDVKIGQNSLDRNVLYSLMKFGLHDDTHCELIKKFMPRIRSNNRCNTDWARLTNMFAKEFAKHLRLDYTRYNKLKALGTAHEFQKIICSKRFAELDWKRIPGRALNLIAASKLLKNHGLEDTYMKWLEAQPIAKFVGYPFELLRPIRSGCSYKALERIPIYQRYTINKQFEALLEKASQNGALNKNVLVALDTSGSMGRVVAGLNNTTCEDIALSLAIFFAKLNKGAFHDTVIMFDNKSYPYTLPSDGFLECALTMPSVPWGGTNFQSVIDEIVKIRKKRPEIPLEEYPTCILAVSDMEFNTPYYGSRRGETNHEAALEKLREVFPSEWVDNLLFIWWNCASRYTDGFESKASDKGTIEVSGFDGSLLTFLLNEEAKVNDQGDRVRPTAEDLVKAALSQEILTFVEV